MRILATIVLFSAILLSVAGCGEKRVEASANTQSAASATTSTESSTTEPTSSADSTVTFVWPESIPTELRAFDGVQLNTAVKDVYAANAWTIYFECSETQKIYDYIKKLKVLGYAERNMSENKFGLDYDGSSGSVDIHINYIPSGLSKLYISLKGTTNSGTSGNSKASDSTSAESTIWPAAIKSVPQFTKGSHKGTLDMGGGMYMISYQGVTPNDLDWYRKTLEKAGFVKVEGEDTEGYAKPEKDKAYSVGFTLDSGNLQVIVASAEY